LEQNYEVKLNDKIKKIINLLILINYENKLPHLVILHDKMHLKTACMTEFGTPKHSVRHVAAIADN
jgi:hypothetical protein